MATGPPTVKCITTKATLDMDKQEALPWAGQTPFPSSPVNLRSDMLKHGAEAGQYNGQDTQKSEHVVPGEKHHVLHFPFWGTPAKQAFRRNMVE